MFFSLKKISIFSIIVLFVPLLAGLSGTIYNQCNEYMVKQKNVETFTATSPNLEVETTLDRPKFYISDKMGWPVEDIVISSHYGKRDYRETCKSCSKFHEGLDFTPGEGKNVLAAMNGTVIEIDNSGQYGVFIIIEHDVNQQKWQTVYAHLQDRSIPENLYVGKEVEIGDIIGKVGKTGLTTGPHLHFEVRINNKKVNPLPLLLKNTSSV